MGSQTLFRTVEYPNLPILAKKTGKTGYIEHCKAARVDDDGKTTSELTGPGSAWMELDAALHRSMGIAAAAVTTWLTTRPGARR
ncbi:hypothetical protein ACH5A3_36260 [Streptomyces echinatus]|uniref:hypothetical protein n=1 Tax=Streptomyces echinatus TaxID=67293 RepID=UPI003798B600